MARLADRPNSGLIVGTDNFLTSNRDEVAALAIAHRLPSIFAAAQLVDSGGLMSYGQEGQEPYRGAAIYVDRILKGANPADLPETSILVSSVTLSIRLAAVAE
jgi:putative ABC transport system substrate-binding protein